MQFRDVSFSTPEENLLYDDVLLYLADKEGAGEFIRFWESPVYFIVLGMIGKEEVDVDLKKAKADGIPLYRRSSGGGTVIQGPGCWNFSFVLSKDRPGMNDLSRSYRYILEKVLAALQKQNIEADFFPISDLALKSTQRKFSGNAQKRGKHFILHHGTILHDFDLSVVFRYLKMPENFPEYRKKRTHEDFVTNIPINIAQLQNDLMSQYVKECKIDDVNFQESALLKQFVSKRSILIQN